MGDPYTDFFRELADFTMQPASFLGGAGYALATETVARADKTWVGESFEKLHDDLAGRVVGGAVLAVADDYIHEVYDMAYNDEVWTLFTEDMADDGGFVLGYTLTTTGVDYAEAHAADIYDAITGNQP